MEKQGGREGGEEGRKEGGREGGREGSPVLRFKHGHGGGEATAHGRKGDLLGSAVAFDLREGEREGGKV